MIDKPPVWQGPGSFGEDPISKEATFQQSAVRKLHTVWFPDIPFTAIRSQYLKENTDTAVSWEWYSSLVSFPDGVPPELSFWKNEKQWSINLNDMLGKPLNKWAIYEQWSFRASEALIFPIVGKIGVLSKGLLTLENQDGIVKWYKDEPYVFELIQSYALRIVPTGITSEFD